MANKISLFKKIKIFREFRKILKLNKTELEQIFGNKILLWEPLKKAKAIVIYNRIKKNTSKKIKFTADKL